MSINTPVQFCSVKAPCGGKHCYLCKPSPVYWFHIPPSAKVGRRKHAKRGPIRAYFGF